MRKARILPFLHPKYRQLLHFTVLKASRAPKTISDCRSAAVTCGVVRVPSLCDNSESLCSMADGLFLVAFNLQNANRKKIKCGAVEVRCYVDADECSTTDNVQRVGKSRWGKNGLILL